MRFPLPLLRRDRGGGWSKAPLHLPPHANGFGVGHRDIRPTHDLPGGDIVQQRNLMRETDRQRALGQAALCRHELAPDRVAAFAVERLPGAQLALGDRHDITAKISRLPGRLAAQCRRQHRHAEFQPDQMVGLVHRRVPAAGIGPEAVFLEAGAGVVVWRLQHDIDAPAQIARNTGARYSLL